MESAQQSERLPNVRKLRRRRKAFERGREGGVGVDGAAGRSIESGERERGAQLEALGLLLLRDGDGGEEGFLGWRGIRGIAPQKDLPADAMSLRFEGSLSGAFDFGERSIDRSDRGIDLAGLRLEFRQQRRAERPDQGVAFLSCQ